MIIPALSLKLCTKEDAVCEGFKNKTEIFCDDNFEVLDLQLAPRVENISIKNNNKLIDIVNTKNLERKIFLEFQNSEVLADLALLKNLEGLVFDKSRINRKTLYRKNFSCPYIKFSSTDFGESEINVFEDYFSCKSLFFENVTFRNDMKSEFFCETIDFLNCIIGQFTFSYLYFYSVIIANSQMPELPNTFVVEFKEIKKITMLNVTLTRDCNWTRIIPEYVFFTDVKCAQKDETIELKKFLKTCLKTLVLIHSII